MTNNDPDTHNNRKVYFNTKIYTIKNKVFINTTKNTEKITSNINEPQLLGNKNKNPHTSSSNKKLINVIQTNLIGARPTGLAQIRYKINKTKYHNTKKIRNLPTHKLGKIKNDPDNTKLE